MFNKFKFKEIIIATLLILLIGGFGGLLASRLVLPYISSWPVLRNFDFLKPEAPILITRREEVNINDGINSSDVANRVKNSLVSIYFHEGKPGTPKFKIIAIRTGLIVSSDGVVATPMGDLPANVLATVVLADGSVEGKVLASDTFTGIGFLKISRNNLSILKQDGSRSLLPGEKVLAVWTGENPQEVSVSLIPVVTQSIPRESLVEVYNFARLNAVLSVDLPASSVALGAAVVNRDGAIVGLVSETGKDIQVVRAKDFKLLVDNFFDDSKIDWPNLKMTYQIYGANQAALMNLPPRYGVLVKTTVSPLLLSGDYIYAIDGADLAADNDFQNTLLAKKPGVKVKFKLLRAGAEKEIEVEL